MSDAKKPTPPPPPPAEGAAPAAATPKWVPVMVGLNSLLLVGVLGFMGWSMMHKPAPAEPHGEEEEAAKTEEHAEAPAKKEEAKKEEPKKGEEGHGAPKTAGNGPGPIVRLPDFVVHLRNADLDRYARITFEIEVMGEPDKEQLTAHLPRVRDSFIAYLSDRTVEELSGSEGLGRTKDALYARIRELVPEARFRALYISDFVVQ